MKLITTVNSCEKCLVNIISYRALHSVVYVLTLPLKARFPIALVSPVSTVPPNDSQVY